MKFGAEINHVCASFCCKIVCYAGIQLRQRLSVNGVVFTHRFLKKIQRLSRETVLIIVKYFVERTPNISAKNVLNKNKTQ